MSEQNTPQASGLDNLKPFIEQPSSKEVAKDNSPKKKKKNKKKRRQTADLTTSLQASEGSVSPSESLAAEPLTTEDSSSLQSLTAQPQTLINLPVKPDEWFIKPATYDANQNIVTEETFIFLQNGIEIISLPLTEDNFAALSSVLQEKFQPVTGTEADRFHIRKPLTDEDESDPVMTLTQRNRILATTVLDQKTLKQLIRALQSQVVRKSPLTNWLNNWWHKHKIMRVLLIIAALPLAAVFLYTIFWGMTH